jgi:branched-chain amino acid transport system ATP-binding protein
VTGYGKRQIVNQVNIEVMAGEVVAVIGHNGSGKSTLLKALFRLLPIWSGGVSYPVAGQARTPRALLHRGVVFLPQGNQVFSRLTVLENARIAMSARVPSPGRRSLAYIDEWFPRLREKASQRAGALSGGEKQSLAFACAMALEPHLLLLDEPSLGLSPALAKDALNQISNICRQKNVAALIVEQKVRQVLRIADRAYVLRSGSVTYSGPAVDLEDEQTLRQAFL